MSKNFPIPKFNHRRSVSTEYQMGCFPETFQKLLIYQNLAICNKKEKCVTKAYFRKSQKQQSL
ncbi:hypothetical protein T09_10738 [Trichinella sp. T9]|nr:hypothetical protein T09_10738 [Trichinella sp. T9]